ncbi:MAG: hypothetical protein KA250_05585 [Verrucomicrobiales bacterium]|jgi:hypothetical protein|nr:hypothetical protein [Verrucomicrobiales bacterium]MBP9225080.1 hypothetical protein [Verrucomicrobiales bacterium]
MIAFSKNALLVPNRLDECPGSELKAIKRLHESLRFAVSFIDPLDALPRVPLVLSDVAYSATVSDLLFGFRPENIPP